METIVKILTKDINIRFLTKEIQEQFPLELKGISYSGYKVDKTKFTTESEVKGRIFVPRTESFVTKTSHGKPIPDSIYAPGEIRLKFDPNLTIDQRVILTTLIVNHVSIAITFAQDVEDLDVIALDEIEQFNNDGTFHSHTPVQQNQHIHNINRMILRLHHKYKLDV